ncbi:hypothetical protein HI914_02890 [Erysiphe necator]|nr:hypothetical protein HI914_02890 [Erysiphe necator]
MNFCRDHHLATAKEIYQTTTFSPETEFFSSHTFLSPSSSTLLLKKKSLLTLLFHFQDSAINAQIMCFENFTQEMKC